MSESSEPSGRTAPVLRINLEVGPPTEASEEQKERFLRSMQEICGTTGIVIEIGLPDSATPEQRDAFVKALREAFPGYEIDTKPIDR